MATHALSACEIHIISHYRIVDISINGVSLLEAGINALIADYRGVPVGICGRRPRTV